MKIAKSISQIMFSAAVVLAACSVFASTELRGAHKENGVQCVDCHETEKPSAPAKMKGCFTCHGDYKSLADLTKDLPEANPHDSHFGELECGECHGIHKPTVIFCNKECHNFDFKLR